MAMLSSYLRYMAIGGGVIALGGGYYFSQRIQDNFRSQPFYKDSVRLMRRYRPAVEYFGEPILTRKLDLGTKNANYTDGLQAKLTINVKGPKNKGILYAWCSRPDVTDKWRVDKLDLELKDKGHRWTFFLHPETDHIQTRVLQDGTVLTHPVDNTNNDALPKPDNINNDSFPKPDDTNNDYLPNPDDKLLYVDVKKT